MGDRLTGTTLRGYELQEQIGAGGFGAVYRAYQPSVMREVAVKIILPHFADQPEFAQRFEAEARVIARLEHPHIIPLYDYWQDDSGAYLVMRYIRGGSLKEMIAKRGYIELKAMAKMLDQIAGALAVAHRNQVIHRDIKPGNILLDDEDNAYLADFGIAKNLAAQGMTGSQAVVGSPDYLSPEQILTEPVTARSDLYSLGVMLYECLCGEHPFPNLTAIQYMYKHVNDPLPELAELSDAVRDPVNSVIQRATAKDPADRYPDALALAADFRSAISSRALAPVKDSISEIKVKMPDPTPAPASSNPLGAITIGGSISNSNVAIGHGSSVNVNQQASLSSYSTAFQQIAIQLDLMGIDRDILLDAKAEIEEIQREVAKGDQADGAILQRKFRVLKRIDPKVHDVVTGILMLPSSGTSGVVQDAAKSTRETD